MLVRARPFLEYKDLFDALSSKPNANVIAKFENAFADWVGGEKCVATHSGRDALALIFHIIQLKPGDKVLLPNFICQVVIDAVINSGAEPVLVDSEKDSPNISVDALTQLVDDDVKVIIASHTFGMPCRIDEIQKLASENNIIFIEDCAQALGSTYKGKLLGAFGDFSIFSFNFDKPLSTGMGGVCVVNNPQYLGNDSDIANHLNRTPLRQEKQILKALLLQFFLTAKEKYVKFLSISFAEHILYFLPVHYWLNKSVKNRDASFLNPVAKHVEIFRVFYKLSKIFPLIRRNTDRAILMNRIRAFFALKQLTLLNEAITSRKKNAEFYKTHISNVQHPLELPEASVVFQRYTILCESRQERDEMIDLANSKGIELDHNNWQKTLSQIPKYKKFLHYQDDYVLNSVDYTSRLLHLPTHLFVTSDDLQTIKSIFHS